MDGGVPSTTAEGLPILKKASPKTTGDGLPILEKKSPVGTHDFGMGYKPTPQDIKDKASLDDLERGFDKSQGGGQNLLNPFQSSHQESTPYDVIAKTPEMRQTLLKNAQHEKAIGSAQFQRAQPTQKQPPEQKDKEGFLDKVANAMYLPAFNQGVNDLVIKPFLGGSDFIGRTLDKAYRGITGDAKTPEWLSGKEPTIIGNFSKQLDQDYKDRDKPSNIVSDIAEGAVGSVPLMASLFTGEGELSLASKAPQFVSRATKILATTHALNAYHDATEQGNGYKESAVEGLKGAGEGAMQGLTLDATMLLGGALGKGVVNKLAEKGILKGSKAGQALLHALSVSTVFSGTSAVQDLVNGKDVDMHEAAKNFGMGLMFEAIPVAKGLSEDLQNKSDGKKINDKSAQVATASAVASNLHSESVLRTLMETPKDQLLAINDNIHDHHEDLYAQSIEQGVKAYDEKDLNEKKALYADQLLLKTQGDVKFLAQHDKANLLDVVANSPDLQPEQKADLTDKLNSLNQTEKTEELTNIKKQQNENKKEESSDVAERPAINGQSSEQAGKDQKSDAELNRQENDEKGQNVLSNSGEAKVEPEIPNVTQPTKGEGAQGDEFKDVGNTIKNGVLFARGMKEMLNSPEVKRTLELQNKFKEENGITDDNYKNLSDTEKQKLQEKWLKSDYYKELQNKEKGEPNHAIQEQEAKSVPVQPTSGDSEKVAEGNAKGEEVTDKGKKTGIKKAITEATRIEKNLPEITFSPLMKDHERLQAGKEQVESGKVNPTEVAQRIIDEGGNYHDTKEAPAMLYYGHQLARENENLREQISATDNPEDKNLLINRLQQNDDAQDKFTQANRINSHSWGNLGNAMQVEADESFNPANIRSIIRENYGGTIPKDVEERIKKAESERDQAVKDLKKATEDAIKKNGERTVEKIRKSIKLVKQSKVELQQEAEQLVNQLRSALKHDSARMNSGIPLPTETLAVLGKLAVNYFKQGVKDFEGLANKIYDDLKETGVEKGAIREYLSNYEPLRDEAKAKELERLGSKERSANKQLETGNLRDYSRKPKIVFKKDNEVIKAEQRVADAEYKIRKEKLNSYKATEKGYQRFLNWVIRWERRSVLASPLILEKLTSAATIGAAVNRIPKQLIGGAFSSIFKRLAEKAPIEGGMNMDAELAFWKEFTDPKKFVKNSAEILKSGVSPLTKQFTDKAHEHYAGWDALMDLHTIIKDPPKRATFEVSRRYAYDWAAKNNLDYTDPLVKRSLDLAAFKRAEYEIFQENSGIAKRVNDFINSERKRTDFEATKKFLYRFLVPISTVPLNIARRLGSSIAGLPHGLYLTERAYRDGIDNLSNEQADYILRQLKNGSVGLAYFSLGMFASKAIMGGVWNKDDKSGKKPTPQQAGFNEMKPLGVPIDKRIQHAMPLFMMQLGATTARVYNHYLDIPTEDPKYQTMLKSGIKAMAATTGAVVDEIPMVQEPVQAVESLSDPYERGKFGEDIKRRVGFSITDDLGITKSSPPADKKLSTVTNDNGDKQTLSNTQLKQRKDLVTKILSDNPKDWPDKDENKGYWTKDFNDDWPDSKANKDLQKNVKYWKQIGRSDEYIKNKIADTKAQKLNEYLEKNALDLSKSLMTDDDGNLIQAKKNNFSIK